MYQQPSDANWQPRVADTVGVGHPVTWILGVYLLSLVSVLSYVLLKLWPHVLAPATQAAGEPAAVTLFRWEVPPSVCILLLAMTMGGLGSYLHVARSFIVFVGNGQLVKSWVWWYVLWPFIGMTLAVIVCFVIHAGFLSFGSSGAAPGGINPYGIAGISALVGMFAKAATEKLREVFEIMFKVSQPTPLADKVGSNAPNPIPSLASIDPEEIEPWSGELAVKVTGQGFIEASEVLARGSPRRTEFVSATELIAHLLSEDTVSEGIVELKVHNPPSGGGTSGGVTLQVRKTE